jgi:hypothetical protein
MIATAALLAQSGPGSEITVTGVPAGSGPRMGIDRDCDTYYDSDELEAGSDPGNPASTPENVAVRVPTDPGLKFAVTGPNPFRGRTEWRLSLGRTSRVDLTIHDVLGREVRSVARGLWLESGTHTLTWDGRMTTGEQVPAGVYFVRLEALGQRRTGTLVRIP